VIARESREPEKVGLGQCPRRRPEDLADLDVLEVA
jgi:hypothetical protein